MRYAALIKEIGRGAKGARPLDQQQAASLWHDMLTGQVPDLELGAILLALRIKSESPDELAGFQHAQDQLTHQLTLPASSPRLVVLPSYNGARRQANLMPLVAELLTRDGIPVLIQGRHDFDTRSNPFSLLTRLGVPLSTGLADAQQRLASHQVACLPVEALLPGMADLLALRPRLGVRSVAHTMAKLIDPAQGRSVRVVAVTHPEYLERMQDHLVQTASTAMLMRGTEGEPYANPRRCPQIERFSSGIHQRACEQDEGGAPPIEDYTDSPETDDNARIIGDMLAGRLTIPEPILRQVAILRDLARA